jgi:2-polyprenyl-3-methyl-5-hydroxy-6-metoxy-1,4-benzoquinol methylase
MCVVEETPMTDVLMDVPADEVIGRNVGVAFVEVFLRLMPGMRERLVRGAVVLDAGCGRGHVLNVMARMFPRSVFRGYDLSSEAIAAAREVADDRGVRNVDFEVFDVRRLTDEPEEYDLITAFDAIHGQSAPLLVLANLVRSLKPGGAFLMQEMWGQERARQLLTKAGFTQLRFTRVPADPVNYYCVATID